MPRDQGPAAREDAAAGERPRCGEIVWRDGEWHPCQRPATRCLKANRKGERVRVCGRHALNNTYPDQVARLLEENPDRLFGLADLAALWPPGYFDAVGGEQTMLVALWLARKILALRGHAVRHVVDFENGQRVTRYGLAAGEALTAAEPSVIIGTPGRKEGTNG